MQCKDNKKATKHDMIKTPKSNMQKANTNDI